MEIQEYIDAINEMPSKELIEAIHLLQTLGIVDCRQLPFMGSVYKYAATELVARFQ